jgi:4,5-DOPA dioxygenase extradiol
VFVVSSAFSAIERFAIAAAEGGLGWQARRERAPVLTGREKFNSVRVELWLFGNMEAIKPMPAIFFGHGNPMNALRRNRYTKAWAAIAAKIPQPRAVLCVSAHWYIARTAVTAMPLPPTIHDIGSFPRALHEFQYPARGDLELAGEIHDLLAPIPVSNDQEWGLDHGTWSVLRHVFPQADVPVVQLSIDKRQPAGFHYELGKRLAPLRDEGVLVIGSGNIVHNLARYVWREPEIEPFPWALRFEQRVREFVLADDAGSLVAYENLGDDALMSAPTPDHYLPLLYVMGLRREGDRISFPVEGFDGGAMSMLSVQLG